MSTMTIRLPDDKHFRIKQLARARKISVNKLLEDLATTALAGHDAEVRFRALASKGSPAKALKILDRLDADTNTKNPVALLNTVRSGGKLGRSDASANVSQRIKTKLHARHGG